MKLDFVLITLLLTCLGIGAPFDHTDTPVVHAVLFWLETCPVCHEVRDEIFPALQHKYGEQLHITTIEISSPANYETYLAAVERYDIPPERQRVPALVVGNTCLVGAFEIGNQFEGLIQTHLSEGGVGCPPIPGLEAVAGPVAEAPEPSEPEAAPIHLAYFYQPGCQECDRVSADLNYLRSRYPQLIVESYDVRENAALCEWMGERNDVPILQRLTAPVVFVGGDYLLEHELDARSIEALLTRYEEDGAERVWDAWQKKAGDTARRRIVERFRSFSLPTVLVAGLIDGLNPCAFATLVFFISYLAFLGRRGREVLLAGGAFSLGVFLTYLGVGVGLLKLLAAVPFLTAISPWLYGLTAVLCLFLAAGSLHDWWQVRKGNPEDMRLKLPTRLRRWINRVIREGAGLRAFVPVAFATGAVISVIELACTGQVYLPTIIFVLGAPGLQARAGVYMLLYNLMFVLPLVVVFLLAYFGTTSQQLGQFINRRAATIKLATAGLFILLAGWLVTALV